MSKKLKSLLTLLLIGGVTTGGFVGANAYSNYVQEQKAVEQQEQAVEEKKTEEVVEQSIEVPNPTEEVTEQQTTDAQIEGLKAKDKQLDSKDAELEAKQKQLEQQKIDEENAKKQAEIKAEEEYQQRIAMKEIYEKELNSIKDLEARNKRIKEICKLGYNANVTFDSVELIPKE